LWNPPDSNNVDKEIEIEKDRDKELSPVAENNEEEGNEDDE